MPAKTRAGSTGPRPTSEELDSLRDEVEQQRATLEILERDRDLLEEEVQLEEKLYAAVVRQMPAGLVVVDALTGQFILRNDQAALLWGRDIGGPPVEGFDELRGRRPDGTVLASDEWPLARTIRTGESIEAEEVWITRVDGNEALLEISSTPVRDAAGRITAGVAIFLDATRRKRAEESVRRGEKWLRAALSEREALLRETRHRTGNTLQIVSSLVGLQASKAADDATRLLLRETEGRILVMARLHQQIQTSPDAHPFDLTRCVRLVVDQSRELYASVAGQTEVVLDVAAVQLGMDAIVRSGLVVSELVSNAFKHAFPGGRPGRVAVAVRETGAGMVEIEVTDDGVGVPAAFAVDAAPTLGLPLAEQLARQLGGSLCVERATPAGTAVRVCFPAGGASGEDASARSWI